MDKIANTPELMAELRQILAYAESEQPSREKLALALASLATRTAGGLDSVRSEAYRFFLMAERQWAHVEFTSGVKEGWVQWADLGKVTFRESGNEAAVIVNVPPIYMKARAEQIYKALTAISRVVGKTGL